MLTQASIDRISREHVGEFSRAIFSDDERPFVILKLADGTSCCGPATSTEFHPGQQYRFRGRWRDGKFGPEFVFETYTRELPLNRCGVVKYLRDFCSHIGQVTAERLFDKFGADAVRTLREDPFRVANSGLLSPAQAQQAALDLERVAQFEHTKIELFDLFAGRGFPGQLINRTIAAWGIAAPDVIRRNPFSILVRKFPGCGFRRCDRLYLDLGKHPATLKRQALAAWSILRDDRTGSTWIDANTVAAAVDAMIPNSDPFRAMILLRRAGWIRVRRAGANRFVALRERADAEQRVADNVRRLRLRPSMWPTEVETTQTEGDDLPSQHQAENIKAATAQSVGCFTGGPGTGKTHTLAFLLKRAIQQHGRGLVAVCAPTGKAAVRAGESLRSRGLDIHATTIHRLLDIGRNGHDGDGWGFQRNRENPLTEMLVIVDEASMIDASLMADLLDAIPDGGSILFCGDTFQLAPVGHGAPLRDMIEGGVAVGELTEVRRNAGTIVRACRDLKAGLHVRGVDRLDLDADDPANLRFLDCQPKDVIDVLDSALDAIERFDIAWEVQILTPLNEKSDVSRVKLNERFGHKLNPDGKSAKGNTFRVGDKIICLRNTSLKIVALPQWPGKTPPAAATDAAEYVEIGGENTTQYVANGEIGRVIAVSEKHSIARFGGMNVGLVQIANRKQKRGDGADSSDGDGGAIDFELAWAITSHRSQGSEWPCVIVLVDEAGTQIADRNFWYTAISRARKACLVIGPRNVFEKQVKRVALQRRRTFLVEMLNAEVNS